MEQPLYAVITGDIRKSSRLPDRDLARLPRVLKDIFSGLQAFLPEHQPEIRFSVFRGDSFQLVLDPASALEAAIVIRAGLRSAYPSTVSEAVDCRLAIAIGCIEHLSENITESSGEAFTSSGRLLDELKKSVYWAVSTPVAEITRELNLELALADELVKRWTHSQASLVPQLLNDKRQTSIAVFAGISQAAIAKKLRAMSWYPLALLMDRYRELCKQIILANRTTL